MDRFGSMSFRCTRMVPGATLVVLTIAFCCAGVAVSSAAEVRVNTKVESVAHMAGPASIELAPGESREVTIKVAANFPWRLSLGSANPAITAGRPEIEGQRGGFARAGNTIKVTFTCAPDAPGPQVGEIEYLVERR